MTAHRINPLQQKFVENYLRLGNATLAYKMIKPLVKNPDDNAAQMLKRKSVQDLIRCNQDKMNKAIEITFEWKANRLKTFIEECSRKVLIKDEDGNVIDERIPSDYIAAGTRAIAELNKMQGHLAAEKHVNVNITESVDKVKQVLIEYDKY